MRRGAVAGFPALVAFRNLAFRARGGLCHGQVDSLACVCVCGLRVCCRIMFLADRRMILLFLLRQETPFQLFHLSVLPSSYTRYQASTQLVSSTRHANREREVKYVRHED